MSWKHSSGAEGMRNVILWDAVPGASANRLFKLNEQRQNLCCLLQSGVLEGNAGDCSPIGVSQALGDRVHKSVMHQTRHGHRYGGFFGSSQGCIWASWPATTMKSFAASAASGRPNTGAAT